MTKRPATIFEDDFELDDKSVPDSQRTIRNQPKLIPYLVCPCCGLNRPIVRTGIYSRQASKRFLKTLDQREKYEADFVAGKRVISRAKDYNPQKQTRFDIVDIENEPFLMIRAAMGRGEGFQEVEAISLREIIEDGKYYETVRPYLEQIKKQCKKILGLLEEMKS